MSRAPLVENQYGKTLYANFCIVIKALFLKFGEIEKLLLCLAYFDNHHISFELLQKISGLNQEMLEEMLIQLKQSSLITESIEIISGLRIVTFTINKLLQKVMRLYLNQDCSDFQKKFIAFLEIVAGHFSSLVRVRDAHGMKKILPHGRALKNYETEMPLEKPDAIFGNLLRELGFILDYFEENTESFECVKKAESLHQDHKFELAKDSLILSKFHSDLCQKSDDDSPSNKAAAIRYIKQSIELFQQCNNLVFQTLAVAVYIEILRSFQQIKDAYDFLHHSANADLFSTCFDDPIWNSYLYERAEVFLYLANINLRISRGSFEEGQEKINYREKAIVYYEKCLTAPLSKAEKCRVQIGRAAAYGDKECYEMSIPLLTQVISDLIDIYGNNHSDIISAYNRRGELYEKMKDFRKAIEDFTLGADICRVIGAKDRLDKMNKKIADAQKQLQENEYHSSSSTKRISVC